MLHKNITYNKIKAQHNFDNKNKSEESLVGYNIYVGSLDFISLCKTYHKIMSMKTYLFLGLKVVILGHHLNVKNDLNNDRDLNTIQSNQNSLNTKKKTLYTSNNNFFNLVPQDLLLYNNNNMINIMKSFPTSKESIYQQLIGTLENGFNIHFFHSLQNIKK
uniref:Uncharacterized protein orf160b n=1 Tax=Helicosporidium sp. subsp. Simulium jonesii TaxID=145475 RepID=D3IZW7_HELSJ|nr:hypothetical protein HesesjM_p14 [Helicosporidium sp. ex Simulium jonesi]ACT36193.1 hypothetical protein [Helicosporidium sp. ex Simulium jonesi]